MRFADRGRARRPAQAADGGRRDALRALLATGAAQTGRQAAFAAGWMSASSLATAGPPVTVHGTVVFAAGPCGAPRAGSPACEAPPALAADIDFVVRRVADGAIVAGFRSAADGRFRVRVPALLLRLELKSARLDLVFGGLEIDATPGDRGPIRIELSALRP